MRRITRNPSLALLTALALLAAFAGPALAQSDGNESSDGEDDADVDVDVDPEGDDNGTDDEPQEAMGGWLASPTGVLVILVLALVIVGLIVAVAANR